MPPIGPLARSLSLAQQAAGAIREGLQRALWRERLPGERDLSRQLNVSRPTLRTALDLLEREGWLTSAPGRPRSISPRPPSPPRAGNPIVRLLLPFPPQEAPPFLFYWIDKLRELLPGAGCQLEIHTGARWYAHQPAKDLLQLTTQVPASAWVLARATEPTQRWFAQAGLPCIVAGSCYPGVDLPSVDFDHRAVARHAADRLLAWGHRRIVLLVQSPELAGDLETEAGFAEAFDATRHPGATPIVARHDSTRPGIRLQLDRLLRLSPPPTAFFVARSMPALAAASELTRRGYHLPRDIALISRDSDPFLEFFSPELTRYWYDPEPYARRLAALVARLAREGSVSRRQIRLTPDFLPGETGGCIHADGICAGPLGANPLRKPPHASARGDAFDNQ
jgi:DNA-binding LacI/PurR family transcriptional regulator